MGNINYENLLVELIKPLVTHPDEIQVSVESVDEKNFSVNVLVHKDDIGRVIGKKGRVASSIRTLAYTAAMRYNEVVSIEFNSSSEN